MTVDQWNLAVNSKTSTSWNLHQLLPRSLDFFILLSSLTGIYGSPGQSNYAAGCTFQDALARYRQLQGDRALSLDVGWMRSVGVIAETEQYQVHRKAAADMKRIETSELLSLLELACDRTRPLTGSQMLIGVDVPRDILAKRLPVPSNLQRPLFSRFRLLSRDTKPDVEEGQVEMDPGSLFREAAGFENQSAVVVDSLGRKLARILNISAEDVESTKALSDYGVDSLMAVEIRRWLGKEFQAIVAVFDIMNGASIAEIGRLVAERSEYRG